MKKTYTVKGIDAVRDFLAAQYSTEDIAEWGEKWAEGAYVEIDLDHEQKKAWSKADSSATGHVGAMNDDDYEGCVAWLKENGAL